jgi:hypothetical protein
MNVGWKNVSILASAAAATKELINYIHRCGYIFFATQNTNNPDLEYFKSISNMGTDIQQTGLSPIHSLLENN